MRKKDLILKLQELSGISEEEIKALLKALPIVITDAIMSGDKITIQELGTFRPGKRKGRTVKNPATGKCMKCSESTLIGFRTSISAKRKLNEKQT